VHLILANPPWRQLRERAQKIQGDKKHVEGILSQSHCVAQFNTAQEMLTDPKGLSNFRRQWLYFAGPHKVLETPKGDCLKRYYGSNVGRLMSPEPVYFQAEMLTGPRSGSLSGNNAYIKVKRLFCRLPIVSGNFEAKRNFPAAHRVRPGLFLYDGFANRTFVSSVPATVITVTSASAGLP